MIILAFDTTSQQGGAGIFHDDECLAVAENDKPANLYSVTLFEMVERVLAQAGMSFAEIDLYAAANGPGSFTGIRVGLAAAQGWAKAWNKPARGVSTLAALVEAAQPKTDLAAPVLDARRGEFYLGLFRRRASHGSPRNAGFEAAGEGWALKPEAMLCFADRLSPAERPHLTWVARQSDGAARALRESQPFQGNWIDVSGHLLSAIARLASRAQRSGHHALPAELDAQYIRRSDAELNWRA